MMASTFNVKNESVKAGSFHSSFLLVKPTRAIHIGVLTIVRRCLKYITEPNFAVTKIAAVISKATDTRLISGPWLSSERTKKGAIVSDIMKAGKQIIRRRQREK
jgi:hypothetical protein